MVKIANIVCKTVGIAGMSAVTYDAFATAKHHSAVGATHLSNDLYESAVAAQRSNAGASYVTGAMQKKISDLRMQNPVVPFIGKIKGFTEGLLSSLGDNIIPITLSTIAIAMKGFAQKAGAWGLGIYGLYQIAKEGFGMGKNTPIDE